MTNEENLEYIEYINKLKSCGLPNADDAMQGLRAHAGRTRRYSQDLSQVKGSTPRGRTSLVFVTAKCTRAASQKHFTKSMTAAGKAVFTLNVQTLNTGR